MSGRPPREGDVLLGPRRRELVRWAQRLQADGLATGTSGNLSARSSGLVAITPSGVPYEDLTAERVGVHRLDGTPVDAPLAPSTELPLHLAVYRASDAAAVVHTHSLHAAVLSTLVDELPPLHYLLALFGGAPRTAPYAPYGSPELAAGVAAALEGRSAALLANHGAVTTGRSVKEAYAAALQLEWQCELVVKARLLGEPRRLPDGELERLAARLREYGATPASPSRAAPAR